MLSRTLFDSSYSGLDQLRREMERLIGRFSPGSYRPHQTSVFPLVNLSEDKDNYYVNAELPGLDAEDLDITVNGSNISISGQRKITSAGNDVKYHRREREAGKFSRIIGFPGEIDANKVDASLADGVLTVRVAKAEIAKPKKVSVK